MPNAGRNDDAKLTALRTLIDEGDACDPATDVDGEEFMDQIRKRIVDRSKLKRWVPEGMTHADFEIGKTFICGGRRWRCTDIGTRTIIAICLEDTEIVISSLDPAIAPTTRTLSQAEAEAEGWFHGPPYAVSETVFDEYDLPGCSPDQ
jgi:hypothetical protein